MSAPRERDMKAVERDFAAAFCERGPIDEDYSQTPTIGYRYSCGAISEPSTCHACDELGEALGLAGEAIMATRRERDQARGWVRCLAFLACCLAVATAVLLRVKL